jgi:hypothetical protein
VRLVTFRWRLLLTDKHFSLFHLVHAVAVGLVIFSTAQLIPGYTGAGVNPARCFGPALVGNGGWKDFWLVFFLGPLCAAVVHAPIYLLVPPNHVERSEQRKSQAEDRSVTPHSNDTEAPDATARASIPPA